MIVRFLRRMLSRSLEPPLAAVPSVPAPDLADRAELAATRRRLNRKWRRFDGLIEDFRAADSELRIVRR